MIPASADWITVPVPKSYAHEAVGWHFYSTKRFRKRSSGEPVVVVALLWRPRPAIDGDVLAEDAGVPRETPARRAE